MGKADLHLHTRVSDGMAPVAAVVEHLARLGTMDVIAVTDHEDARGGHEARELAAQRGYALDVVVGAEITTRQGHLLALFIEEAPPSFRSVESTLEAIHRQDGLAVIPHPMSWLTRSLSRRTIDRIVRRSETGIGFDAIELGNPSPAGRRTRAAAAAFNSASWRLPATGGSDAHHLQHAGSGWTEFEGKTAKDLRRAIRDGDTGWGMGEYVTFRKIGLGPTALQLAWGYSATPRKVLAPIWPSRRRR